MTNPVDDASAPSRLEARIHEDETRLAFDELRLLEDEHRMRSNRALTIGLAVALAIAVAGLIVALVALQRDVRELSAVAHDSVGTAAIEDHAVTSDKLAADSVTAAALARGAVTGPSVAADSLTGTSIQESSLGQVPSARAAGDSSELAGLPGASYLSGLRTVRAESALDSTGVKGPLSATCPGGSRVLSGGAAVEGVPYGIAISMSAPRGGDEWVAVARRYRRSKHEWRLVVTAICANGGH